MIETIFRAMTGKTSIKNKILIRFLSVFLFSYTVLTFLYSGFLSKGDNKVDEASSLVGTQAALLLNALGFNSFASDVHSDKSTHVGINNFAQVKVIEGCNGLSVMILFVAFLLAFPGSWKQKIWFIPAGVLVIHLFNIARVAILCWAVYSYGEKGYPIYKEMFTASIYVLVLGMWYLWVDKFGMVMTIKK